MTKFTITLIAAGCLSLAVLGEEKGASSAPPVSITLLDRHGHATPSRGRCAHTGGGTTDVAQPASDTMIITMTGAVVATSALHFDLDQCFEVAFDNPKVKKAKVTIEGRVIGLLRGERKGHAEYGDASAVILAGPVELVKVCVQAHGVDGCENLAVNDHAGPVSGPIAPGKYTLHQTFNLSAQGKGLLAKKASAEFAPDPALDPLWISYHEPFHGANKKDFGFQITLKVSAEEVTNGNPDKAEKEEKKE